MTGIYGPLNAAQAAYVIDNTRAVDRLSWMRAVRRVGLGWDALLGIAECLHDGCGDEGRIQGWFASYLHAPDGDVHLDSAPFLHAYRVAQKDAARFPGRTEVRIATLLKYIPGDSYLDSPALLSPADPRMYASVPSTSVMVDLPEFHRWSGEQAMAVGLDKAVLCAGYDKEVSAQGSYLGDSNAMPFVHTTDVALLTRTARMHGSRREESFFITPLDLSLQGLIDHVCQNALTMQKERQARLSLQEKPRLSVA